MAESDRPPKDEEWLTTDESSSSEEEWSTAPASPSGIPASPVERPNPVHHGEFLRCSSRCHESPRQDTDIACAQAGEKQERNVDTASFQPSPPSDLTPISSKYPSKLPINATPRKLDVDKVFDILRPVERSMPRFNKRVYRQGHQTREFFDYQPTLDQGPSEGDSTSRTPAGSSNRHRAMVKGLVQDCPGAENCADCKDGRAAPLQKEVSSTLPADLGIGPSAPKTENTLVESSTTFKLSDVHHGLLHTTEETMDALTKSKAPVNPDHRVPNKHWEIFDCLTDRLRRKAAQDTILHLVMRLEMDKIEKRFRTDNLPFLYEDELFQMITKAKIASEKVSNSGELRDPDEILASSTTAKFGPAAGGPKSSAKVGNKTVAHGKDTTKSKSPLTTEEQKCTDRAKTWGDLLLQENRKIREKWISHIEEELEDEDDDGPCRPEFDARMKTIYERVKAEDAAKLEVKRQETALEDDVAITINRAVSSAMPSDRSVLYLHRHGELLANRNFVKIAKQALKVWCIKNAIPAHSRRVDGMYLNLLKAGEDLARHAWDSALPPVWDSTAMCWLWQDFSKANKGKAKAKAASAPESVGKEKTEASKKTVPSQAVLSEVGPSKLVPSQTAIIEGGEERPVALTRNQRRAKAKREKRKAKKEEAGDVANDPVATPEIPVCADEESEQAVEAAAPENPLRTAEEYREAIQLASNKVKEALASRVGPSTSTGIITRDGQTFREPALGRVKLSTAIELANGGQLRVSSCPAFNSGDAARLLKASHRFQRGIDSKKIGKDPHAVTLFLMKIGMKPSEYEQVLELNTYLEVMNKIDHLSLSSDVVAPAASTTSLSYPPSPPRPYKHEEVHAWAALITTPQLPFLFPSDRMLHLRSCLVRARLLLFNAARCLPPTMFARIIAPGSGVLTADDLPVARYKLSRTVAFTNVMNEQYARYAAEKATNPRKVVKDYVVEAIDGLNEKYETVEEMLVRARGMATGRDFTELLRRAGGEGRVESEMAGPELRALAEEAVGGENGGKEMERLVERSAEGVAEFLAKWPQLEAACLGEGWVA